MPLAGARGAWLARRAVVNLGQRLTAALFPALYPMALGIPVMIFRLFVGAERALSTQAAAYGSLC